MEDVDEEMEGVAEWERGLPGPEEMTPLSQILITAELSCAFSISPEPCKTLMDVTRASHNTLSSLRRHNSAPAKTMLNPDGISANEPNNDEDIGGAQTVPRDNKVESHAKNAANKCSSSGGGAEGGGSTANGGCGGDENEDQSERALKRQRLVWIPELHKRFVDVVAHLGIKNAVPKTIMQLMNVEGLTRENVASHLQKYRLYLKRQGHSDDGAGPADPIFSSSPKFNPFHKDGPYNQQFHPQHNQFQHMPMPMPMMPYGNPMVQMPVMGIAHNSQSAPHGGGLYPSPCGSGSFGMSMPHSGDRGQMHNDLNFRTATK